MNPPESETKMSMFDDTNYDHHRESNFQPSSI
jgi:hypothetical protein